MNAEELKDVLVDLGKKPDEEKFSIIYCDFPWRYNSRKNDGTKFGKGASGHYDTLSTKELCELPVGQIAAKRSLIFMWVTMPKLPDALEIMKCYNYGYSTVGYNWVKTNHDGSIFFGPGAFTGSNSELVLIGRRGKALERAVKNIRQPIISPRMAHSAKPLEVRSRISLMYPTAKKIELFARETGNRNWSYWGLEVPGGFLPPQDFI